jgi:Ca2+-binding EF-hand superfamily protein
VTLNRIPPENFMLAAVGMGIASQAISALISALSPSSGSSSTQTATTSCFQQAVPQASASSKATSAKPVSPLSGDLLMALANLQSQSGSSPANVSSASGVSPVQQLFSAMDSDGDGEVSQGEMETYVEKQGGTQSKADSLFTSLGQTSGVTESQMQSAVSQAQQAQQGHHHGYHGAYAGQQADNVASTLLQAMDSNDNGSVDQSELTNFVTANGGNASAAASDFTALNSSGSGSLNSADFAKAWQAYQQNTQSSGAMAVSFLNAFAQSAGSTASLTA